MERRDVGEPLAGTAPQARLWVLLEQPGPWGRDAVVESHLDSDVGRALQAWAKPHPVRLGLIRRPGRHADDGRTLAQRTALIARCDPGNQWLRELTITDPRELLDQDVGQLLNEETTVSQVEPVIAVCTNAKRDQCCALYGRDVAHALAVERDGQVWETSHLGGHRFAPTLVSLPDGYLFGGPDATQFTTKASRGRSTLAPHAQVAELAALQHFGYRRPSPLPLTQTQPERWTVTDPSTKAAVSVLVTSQTVSTPRPESCHKPAFPWNRLTAFIDPDDRLS